MSTAQKRMWFGPAVELPEDRELIIDSFAGGGGASLGIHEALGYGPDIAVNHSYDALTTHEANHPATHHVLENVWRAKLGDLIDGRPVGLLWASPDCRHFSRAKGSKPVKKQVRGLAWVVARWAAEFSPRVICLENVREFETWGPCVETEDGLKPCPKRKGQTFKRFVRKLTNLGYDVEWCTLNAADYGAPTHRRRLFLIARNDGQPIVWPEATHGPGLLPYRTAAECIDWSIPCPSIFERKKPLAEKTMRRIALGIKRYVLEAAEPFIVRCNHGGDHFRGQTAMQPLATVTGSRGFAAVSPLLSKYHGSKGPNVSHRCQPCDEPIKTLDTQPRFGLVAAALSRYYGNSIGQPVDQPAPVESAIRHTGLLAASLLQTNHTGSTGRSTHTFDAQEPLRTVTSSPGFGVAAAHLVKFRGDSAGRPVDEPMPTITGGAGASRPAGAAHAMGVAAACLARFNHGEKQWNGVDEPLGTVTSQGNKFGLVYAFLMKYFGNDGWSKLSDPLHTVTSKDRFGLVTVEVSPGVTEPAIAVDVPGLGPYVIADIGLRMLQPRELARAQGFPDSYELLGSTATQVAMIGNSVPPAPVTAIIRANVNNL